MARPVAEKPSRPLELMSGMVASDRRKFAHDGVSRRAARRWTLAVAASLVIHAATAAALWRWTPEEELHLLTLEAGRASIALTATIAAAAEEPSPPVEIAPQDDNAAPQLDESPDEEHPAESAVARVEATEPEAAPLLFQPNEPVLVVVEDAATPIVVGGQAERRSESLPAPPPLADSADSPAPARRRFEVKPSLPAAVSVPTPASQAREGVESDEPPQVVVNRPPVYPPDALAAGRTGRVIIRANIAADGRVLEARVHRSSGVTSLDQAALNAVRTWRFSPASHGNAPPRPVNVPIDFIIRR